MGRETRGAKLFPVLEKDEDLGEGPSVAEEDVTPERE